MPEALKDRYTPELISALAGQLNAAYKKFDVDAFESQVFCDEWEEKELKDRMIHLSIVMKALLPRDYSKAIAILKKACVHFSGFEYMCFPEFVSRYGLDQYEVSIDALAHFTPFSSSEFAVRPFIIRYPEKMMAQMQRWAEDENYHVRRLASEGCRPRLPWAMALPEFKKDPTPVLPILEQLKDDDSEYVRRSAANNLNDIAKDHPDIVLGLSESWLGQSKETDWVVKHGCRTLLKQGHPRALAFWGYSAADHISISDFIVQEKVAIGEGLNFSFDLKSASPLGKLRLEYAIHFLKKNGELSKKVFKISEFESAESAKSVQKIHSFRLISTRVYYPGIHKLSVIVNGSDVAEKTFTLRE